MSRLTRRLTTIAPLAVAAGLVLGAGAPARSVALLDPTVVGAWTSPFEEGGAGTPRCVAASESEPDGYTVCKPVAQASAVLPDGRVFYYSGVESSENAESGPSPARMSAAIRDSQARVLDLRSGSPAFTVPADDRGGRSNPNITPGRRPGPADDPFGIAGVPGRPGDGFVGSLAGTAGVPGQDPTAPPDDDADNDGDMFCGDLLSLGDGRILIAGGTDWYLEPSLSDRSEGDPADLGGTELEGLRNATIFDPATNSFSATGPMKYGRWYPTLVELADGKVLAASGVTKLIKNTQLSQVRRTETYDPGTGAWTENYSGPASENSLPNQARLFLAPNNKVFFANVGQMWGPGGEAIDEATYGLQQFFDPETKEWEVAGLAPLGARNSAFVAPLVMQPPYDSMTLLTFGGTLGPPPGSWIPATPLSTLTTIGADGSVQNSLTGNLNHGRWFPSGVLLPDGQVLAVGGADKDHVVSPGIEMAVNTAELYDPATGTWTDVAPHQRDRTYHNTAVLLPDMRVLLGGHTPLPANYGGPNQDQGGPFANNDKDSSFEVWSPPYLFRGPRPTITSAPAGLDYGQTFTIGSPEAGDIESVLLIKPQAAQHINDPDQRALALPFSATAGGTNLEAVAPPTGVAAPPGWYYLVVNRKTPKGAVPSVARMVRIGAGASDPAEALQPFADDAPAPTGGTATPDADTSTAADTQATLRRRFVH